MDTRPQSDGHEEFRRFRAGETTQRVFRWPTCHPCRPTGFCPCDRGWLAALWFYFRSALLLTALKLPFNALKIALLRWSGARVGRNVFISADVWIDPLFPDLLTFEDEVMLGVGAKISLHVFERACFTAGRVVIRKGAIVGGFALIAPGVELGEGAVVVGGAVVGHDVPAGRTAMGNPARLVPPGMCGAAQGNPHE